MTNLRLFNTDIFAAYFFDFVHNIFVTVFFFCLNIDKDFENCCYFY